MASSLPAPSSSKTSSSSLPAPKSSNQQSVAPKTNPFTGQQYYNPFTGTGTPYSQTSAGQGTHNVSGGGGSSAQSASQQAAQDKATLAQQNELTASEARSREANYTIATQLNKSSLYAGDVTKAPTGSYGVPILSNKEASANYNSVNPFYTLSSQSASSSASEGAFASNIPYKAPYQGINTQELFQMNTANIYAGQKAYNIISQTEKQFQENPESFSGAKGFTKTETSEGTQYGLDNSYFESAFKNLGKESQQYAQGRFITLNAPQQIGLKAGSVFVGAMNFASGAKEFITRQSFNALGTQENSNKPFNYGFGLTQFDKELRDYPKSWTSPTGITEIGLSLGIGAKAFKGGLGTIKNLGWEKGLYSSLQSFSSWGFKNELIVPDISKTKMEARSIFAGQENVYTRGLIAKGEDVLMESKQLFTKNIKGSYDEGAINTRITTPYFKFEYGKIDTGVRVSEFTGYGQGKTGTGLSVKDFGIIKLKAGMENLVGGKSNTLMKPTKDIFISERGFGAIGTKYNTQTFRLGKSGSMSLEVAKNVRLFSGGKAEPIYKFNQGVKGNVWSPTGKFKVSKMITGVEIDISKGFDIGNTDLGTSKMFKQMKTKSLSNLISASETAKSFKLPELNNIKSSVKIINKDITKGFQISEQKIDVSLKTSQKSLYLPYQESIISSKSSERGISSLLSVPSLSSLTRQNQRSMQLTNLQTKITTKQITRQREMGITVPTPTYDFGFDKGFKTGIPPLIPPLPSLGGYIIPDRKKRGRKTGYNILPSFTAEVLNIKMKSPLKVSREFGVLPTQTRALYTGKGKYFKLTNL